MRQWLVNRSGRVFLSLARRVFSRVFGSGGEVLVHPNYFFIRSDYDPEPKTYLKKRHAGEVD